jgi:hypothetical protein
VAKRFKGKNVEFVLFGLAGDIERQKNTVIRKFLKKINVNMTTVVDTFSSSWIQWTAQKGEKTSSEALPRTVIINSTQQFVAGYGHEGADFEALLTADLKNIKRLCKPKRR